MTPQSSLAEVLRENSVSADALFAVDADQRIVLWNSAAEQLLAFTQEEVIGRQCYEVLHGVSENFQPVCERGCAVMRKLRHREVVRDFDVLCRAKTGPLLTVNIGIVVEYGQGNEPRDVVHFLRDVTHRALIEHLFGHLLRSVQGHHDSPTGVLRTSSPASGSSIVLPPNITPRERDVLGLLADGLSTREIARALAVEPVTVRNHIQRLLQKLGAHSRLEAVALARQHGFGGQKWAE